MSEGLSFEGTVDLAMADLEVEHDYLFRACRGRGGRSFQVSVYAADDDRLSRRLLSYEMMLPEMFKAWELGKLRELLVARISPYVARDMRVCNDGEGLSAVSRASCDGGTNRRGSEGA